MRIFRMPSNLSSTYLGIIRLAIVLIAIAGIIACSAAAPPRDSSPLSPLPMDQGSDPVTSVAPNSSLAATDQTAVGYANKAPCPPFIRRNGNAGGDGDQRIVFSMEQQNPQGRSEIYLMNSDGSDITPITCDGNVNVDPSWFPDGKKIVYSHGTYASVEDSQNDIYVMNADGSDPVRLPYGYHDSEPVWSPDGDYIAFTSYAINIARGGSNIIVMKADGSGAIQVAEGDRSVSYFSPDWAPDGNKIVYVNETISGAQISIMNADGSNKTEITEHAPRANLGQPVVLFHDQYPAWSPDGTRIAFSSDRDKGRFDTREIYVMNVDGSELTRLTFDEGFRQLPSWSADGTKIYYFSVGGFLTQLYVINADGSEQTALGSDQTSLYNLSFDAK